MNFRPFTEDDWDCFAGCETDSPLMGVEDVSIFINDKFYSGIAIVDGTTISMHMYNEDGDQDMSLARFLDYPDQETHEQVVEIAKKIDPTWSDNQFKDYLLTYHFRMF